MQGKNISLMEITKVLPTLLYRFRFDFVPRDRSQRRRVPRDSNGSEAEPATTPWRTNSTWFLDVEVSFFFFFPLYSSTAG